MSTYPKFTQFLEGSDLNLRVLVYLVIFDSGQVSFEHLLLSWHPSQRTLRLSSCFKPRFKCPTFKPKSKSRLKCQRRIERHASEVHQQVLLINHASEAIT